MSLRVYMNNIGIVVALATFCGIWFGHVFVRKIEFMSSTIWLPSGIFAVLGIGLEYLGLISADRQLSVAFAIFGITLLWDALEFYRQQARIKKGHAPVNPNNPRHVRIMAKYPTATLDPFQQNSADSRIIQDLDTYPVDKQS